MNLKKKKKKKKKKLLYKDKNSFYWNIIYLKEFLWSLKFNNFNRFNLYN